MELLKDLNSVTCKLQDDCTTISDVRKLFDAVIDKFPETSSRLKPDAEIVRDDAFEAAVLKIQEETATLSEDEKESVTHLEILREETPEDSSLSFAEAALKKRRLQDSSQASYLDLRFIVPTSNMCERLFSKAGHALSSRRMSILPSNFEAQIFLHINRNLWNTSDVMKAMK